MKVHTDEGIIGIAKSYRGISEESLLMQAKKLIAKSRRI